jgi:hypothetical protein
MPKRCGDSSRANARPRVETNVCPQCVEAGGAIAPAALGVCLAPGCDWGVEGHGRFCNPMPTATKRAATTQGGGLQQSCHNMQVLNRSRQSCLLTPAREEFDRLQRLLRLAAILFMPRFTEPLWRR